MKFQKPEPPMCFARLAKDEMPLLMKNPCFAELRVTTAELKLKRKMSVSSLLTALFLKLCGTIYTSTKACYKNH